MRLNVGPVDSIIRIILGISLLFSVFMGYIGAWGYVGAVLIATGLGRSCPVYGVCSISSNKSEEKASHGHH